MSGPNGDLQTAEAEIARITQFAKALADDLVRLIARCEPQASPPLAETDAAACVRGYLQARRRRENLFPADLFADPAWDILLDLFASSVEGRCVSVSDACVASTVPPSTALRWIARLEELNFVHREADPNDARRFLLSLSPRAFSLVMDWTSRTFDCRLPSSGSALAILHSAMTK